MTNIYASLIKKIVILCAGKTCAGACANAATDNSQYPTGTVGDKKRDSIYNIHSVNGTLQELWPDI